MALVLAGIAHGTNAPNTTLDSIASEVAGHTAQVWCEQDATEWDSLTTEVGLSPFVAGFTNYSASNVVYLSPAMCSYLLYGLQVAPTYRPEAAQALEVLLHESVHQRGVLDEWQTDCTALSLLRQYVASAFRLPETITKTYYTTRVYYVRIHGKRVKRVVRVRHTVVLPNPALADAVRIGTILHGAMPAPANAPCA